MAMQIANPINGNTTLITASSRITFGAQICRSIATNPHIKCNYGGSVRCLQWTNVLGCVTQTPLTVIPRLLVVIAGHDAGAENWATIASLIESCKLNAVDPFAYLSSTHCYCQRPQAEPSCGAAALAPAHGIGGARHFTPLYTVFCEAILGGLRPIPQMPRESVRKKFP